MPRERAPDPASRAIYLIEQGLESPEADVVALLRSPACARRIAELLARSSWIRSQRRSLPLLVRHPGCPRAFALDTLARLGWNDLLQVAADPRVPPPVRRRAEQRLADRLGELTPGERASLARRATRGLISAFLSDASPQCIGALLDNPRFTESDAVRLVNVTREPGAIRLLLGHHRFCRNPTVARAALVCARTPLGVALGLLPLLPRGELGRLSSTTELRAPLRDAARALAARRQDPQGRPSAPGT